MLLKDVSSIVVKSDFSVFKKQIEDGGIIKMICVPSGASLSRRQIDEYTSFVSDFGLKGLAYMKMTNEGLNSSIIKFMDLFIFITNKIIKILFKYNIKFIKIIKN